MFSHFGKYAHILELGSPVQELGYLFKNFDPGRRNWDLRSRNWIPCWSRSWNFRTRNYDPRSSNWNPGSGTGFRARTKLRGREPWVRTKTSRNWTPWSKNELGSHGLEGSGSRTQELVPRTGGTRIPDSEAGIPRPGNKIPEPKKLVPRTKGTRIPDSKAGIPRPGNRDPGTQIL